MSPRTRTSNFTTHKGKIVTNGNIVAGNYTGLWQTTNTCSDQTGPGDCAPLSVSKLTVEGGRVNVRNNASNYWDDYRVDYLDNPGFTHLGPLPGQDQFDVAYATQAVARTNPSRPYVDIPVNILELGDIARTLRVEGSRRFLGRDSRTGQRLFSGPQSGDASATATSRSFLRYEFGIKPLVGDLAKLTRFQDQLARRVAEMERLKSAKGLRRTVELGSWERYATQSKVMQSVQAFWTDTVNIHTSQLIKGHARWLPEMDFSSIDTTAQQRLAMRAVLGLTFDSKTVWEAIPWSWLIDWCSNVSEFFAATRNIIPATLSGIHIMRETRSVFTTDGQAFANGVQSPIKATYVTKTRNPSFVAPVAHFPFLNGEQMGILASLAITRSR